MIERPILCRLVPLDAPTERPDEPLITGIDGAALEEFQHTTDRRLRIMAREQRWYLGRQQIERACQTAVAKLRSPSPAEVRRWARWSDPAPTLLAYPAERPPGPHLSRSRLGCRRHDDVPLDAPVPTLTGKAFVTA